VTLEEYMDGINPLHAKALKEVAAARGVLFVMTELVPDEVRDNMLERIKEVNNG
jgi:hypothetical protein